MRKAYLAGGINGLSDGDAMDWREEAKRLLSAHGIDALDPMSRDYRGVEDMNVAEIVHGDLADIAECDSMIAYCPRPSWGTAMEIHHAGSLLPDMYIVAVLPEGGPVSPWLRYFADEVVTTLEEAVARLARGYE